MSFYKEIQCPECGETFSVEITDEEIAEAKKNKPKKKKDLKEFLEESKNRDWEEKLKRTKEKEQKRKQEIEQRFRTAKEKPEDLEGDEYHNPFEWE